MGISVAMCIYNGESYLYHQLQSIFDQSEPVDEIVICDDCSTDGTVQIIDQFRIEHDQKIKLVKNNSNIGCRKNFEQAISLCTGDYIFLSDQDDVWEPNKVEQTIDFFKNNPKYLGVFSDAKLINASDDPNGRSLWETLLFPEILQKHKQLNVYKSQLLYRNFATGACMAFRREAVDLILPFNLPARMWHDEWIALKLAEQDKLYFLNEKLVKYRIHENQQTTLPIKNCDENLLEIKRSIFNDEGLYPLYSYFHWHRAEKGMKVLSAYFTIPPDFIETARKNKRQYLVTYFKTLPFISRKLKLVKWRLTRNSDVSISDIVLV